MLGLHCELPFNILLLLNSFRFSVHLMDHLNDNNSSSNGKMHEHKGQKEVVLSRPPTPLRRHFPDNVLEALTKTTNEMEQSNQVNTIKAN